MGSRTFREPELSRGHRNMNFPKMWRASQELSQSIYPPGKAREAMGVGGVRIWRNVKLVLLAQSEKQDRWTCLT